MTTSLKINTQLVLINFGPVDEAAIDIKPLTIIKGGESSGKTMILKLTVDTAISSPMEYLEIFMKRMLLCRTAAGKLGLTFHLEINGQKLV